MRSSLLSPSARHFLDPQRAVDRGEDVEQDLEPHPRQPVRVGAQHGAGEHEIAAHRVGQFHARHPAGQRIGKAAGLDPVGPAPFLGAGPFGKAAGVGEVEFAAFDRRQHLRQQLGVVLVVGIHHRHHRGCCGAHPLDRGRGEATAPDPLDHPHPRIVAGDGARLVGGAVGAVVIDEDRLPPDARQRLLQPGDHARQIATLVIGGKDHAQPQGHCSEPFQNGIADRAGAHAAAKVETAHAVGQGAGHCRLDPRRRCLKAERVTQQHRRRQHHGNRVGLVLPGNVGGRTVDRLVEAFRTLGQRGRSQQAD